MDTQAQNAELLHSSPPVSEDLSSDSESQYKTAQLLATGRYASVGGRERYGQAVEYVRSQLSIACYEIKIIDLVLLPKATVVSRDGHVRVEGRSEYRRRLAHISHRSRQRCWIVAEFEVEEDTEVHFATSSELQTELYYGCIDEIWRAKVSFRQPGEQLMYTKMFHMVRVDWMNGLRRDRLSNVPFVTLSARTKRGSLHDINRSVEGINCIVRSLAFLDHGGRRYFLDAIESDLSEAVQLGGLMR
ncbi:hypothetical protein FGB62_139g010 [Gracilaria domingensis]|nr:hypothetical protein FGB62_139g010 [Gracilaria domingensis]